MATALPMSNNEHTIRDNPSHMRGLHRKALDPHVWQSQTLNGSLEGGSTALGIFSFVT